MMHSASIPDAFLDSYIGTNDQVKKRCLTPLDFDGELDNEMNDVPAPGICIIQAWCSPRRVVSAQTYNLRAVNDAD
jgi:hypothetical protein